MATTRTNSKLYVAVAVFFAELNGSSEETLFQETFHLVHGKDETSARREAELVFRDLVHSYSNQQGQTVSWRLLEIVDVAAIGETELRHGSELYTRHFRDFNAYKKFEPALEGSL